MTRSEMFDWAKTYLQDCLDLAENKNRDYAQDEDPFFNLRRGGLHGIAVRLDDKVSRLINLSDGRSAAVEDESLDDTLRDILNYAWLAAAFRAEQNGKLVYPPAAQRDGDLHPKAPAWLGRSGA